MAGTKNKAPNVDVEANDTLDEQVPDTFASAASIPRDPNTPIAKISDPIDTPVSGDKDGIPDGDEDSSEELERLVKSLLDDPDGLEDTDEGPDENPEVAGTVEKLKSKAAGYKNEDVEAFLQGQEDLSEEFKANATMIFEAAVASAVAVKTDKLVRKAAVKLQEFKEENYITLSEALDGYLTKIVSEWLEENKLAVHTGIKSEITENFILGLKNLFKESYVDIPEEAVDVVAELSEKVAALESDLNEEINKNVSLLENLNKSHREQILAESCAGLSALQIEKLKEKATHVAFETPAQFSQTLKVLVESYFPETKPVRSKDITVVGLDENAIQPEVQTIKTDVDVYAEAISVQAKSRKLK